ncbi:hypothetical protein F5Y19DRAFT_431090 [Xylariaceae sp. FL1651]|nr:hypothetical protein F5Y19DRAFT_431090 [Xylariaceae sp. FL1651]
MDSQPGKASNYGNAGNIGQVQNDQYNNFGPRKAVNIRRKSQRHTEITNNYQINNHINNHNPPAWPDNFAATFIYRHTDFQGPGTVWSRTAGNFVSEEEEAQLADKVRRLWNQTETIVKELDVAISECQARYQRNEDSEESEPREAETGIPPGESTERSIINDLERAIDLYSRGFRKQSPVLGNLRDINTNIVRFYSWLKVLPKYEQRFSVYSVLKYILGAIADDEQLDDGVVESVAAVVRAFGSNLNGYMNDISTSRLTGIMQEDTVDIFESIAGIFVQLLKYGGRKLKPPQRENIDVELIHLKDKLISVENASKARLNPLRMHGVDQYSGPLPRDDPSLVAGRVHAFLGEQLLQEDSDKSADSPAGLSAAILIYYLDYDATIAVPDIEKCLKSAKPKSGHMQKLNDFERREAYQSWLTDESKCSSLLVYGMSASTGYVSPLSYLCARIAKERFGKENVVVLSYFCGLRRVDTNPNAIDLLCQLIGQLLSHKTVVRLYAMDPVDHNLEKKIKAKNLNTLLYVFCSIIRGLQKYNLVIFCVIDSITKIEQGKLRKDTGIVLEQLSGLVRELNGSVRGRGLRKRNMGDIMVFKLLVTDWARSLIAHHHFSSRYTIRMLG